MDVCADGLPPGRQAGVVPAVPHPGPSHQQLGQRPRPRLLSLQADPTARGIEIQNLPTEKKEGKREIGLIKGIRVALAWKDRLSGLISGQL